MAQSLNTIVFVVSTLFWLHSKSDPFRISTLTPLNTCLYPLPHRNFEVATTFNWPVFTVRDKCLELRNEIWNYYGDFDLYVNLSSKVHQPATSHFNSENLIQLYMRIEPPPKGQIFLLSHYFGFLDHTTVQKVNNLETLLLLPRNDLTFTLVEYEFLDDNVFPFILSFSKQTQTWAIEISKPDKILCNMDYYFDILARRIESFEIVEEAHVIVNVEESFCFAQSDDIMRTRRAVTSSVMSSEASVKQIMYEVKEGDFFSRDPKPELELVSGNVYSYSWSPADGKLYIDTNSGYIMSREKLDFETAPLLWTVVQVFEEQNGNGIFREVKTANISVKVEDVNDSPPLIINPLPLVASIYPVDSVSVGTPIFTLLVNDPDVSAKQARQWRVSTNTARGSKISSSCWWSPCLSALDYFGFGSSVTSSGANNLGGTFYPQAASAVVEKISIVVRKTPIPANSQFVLPIRIEDEIGNSLETALSIVTAPLRPQFAEREYLWKIPEEIPVGTEVGQVVAASFSKSTIVYSMSVLEGDSQMFDMERRTGRIFLRQKLDYEQSERSVAAPKYALIVTASESKIGGLSSSTTVSVEVTDSNDCVPAFTENAYVIKGLSETTPIGESILSVKAKDCDATWPNNQVSIISTDPRFYFDNSSSSLKVASPLDFDEGVTSFLFNLVVQDGGSPPLSNSARVKILLVNKADEAPVFINVREDGTYFEKVSESITEETIVAKVDAIDPDGLADKIRFSFEPTAFANPFFIDEETGIVKKKAGSVLSESEYKLRVRAVDDLTALRGDDRKESFATLVIQVLEENNHKPTFKDCDKLRYVSESAEVGTVVFEVEAVDEDHGRYGQIKYGLVSLLANSNSLPEFQIRQNIQGGARPGDKVKITGQVILLRKISRDDGEYRTLTINATDTYSPVDDSLLPANHNVGVCTVTVKVTDANDKSPIFAIKSYSVDIPSVKKIGETIIRVVAYDNDEGQNGEIFYRLIDLSRGDNFQINSVTGDVSVKSPNLAQIKVDTTYNLIVTATDKGQPPRSTNATITIKVLSKSDIKPPAFVLSESNISVPENHQIGIFPGSEIGVFEAQAAKRGEQVLITLQTGSTVGTNSDKTFAIPAPRGDVKHKLFVVKPIDYEKIKRYYLTVKASLASNQNIYTLKQVTIEVTDVNDEVPEFVTPDETFYGSVKEDDAPGTYVATVRAEDKDLGLGGEVRYSMPTYAGIDTGTQYFQINEKTGIVTLLKSLSNLDPPRSTFHLSAQAKDSAASSNIGTVGPNINSVYVAINVIDVNDHPPKFSEDVYYVNVEETTPVGDVILGVSASDEDKVLDQSLTYRIERGNIRGAFEINPNSGLIKLARPLDFDFGEQRYNLTVLASDGKLAGRASVIVNVVDENDEAPLFGEEIYNAETVENDTSAIGKTILQVQAVDQDLYLNPPGQVRYRLNGDGANTHFAINEITGDVRVSQLLDREHRSQWNLLVYAEDISPNVVPNSDQLSSAELSITVRDINDNPPFFIIPDKKGTIPENRPPGSIVMSMPAKDADENAQLTYTLVDGPLDLFEIDPVTAEIKTKVELDREDPNNGFQFALKVQAEDEDGFSTTGTAFVEVSDLNDNSPSCERDEYYISVSEGAIRGQSVFMFNIIDKDTHSVNGENKVQIMAGNIATVFDVTNPMSGIVNLLISSIEGSGEIDYESDRKTYNLTIQVSDPTLPLTVAPGLSSQCKLHITVLDYNDNAPIFDPSSVDAVEVNEDVSVGYVIAQVTATDSDENGKQDIRFEVDWETDIMDWFKVEALADNPKVAQVIVKNPLDREMITHNDNIGVYTFNVLAIDRPQNIEQPRLQGSINIVVRLKDVNDNAPVWAKNYKPVIPENEGPGTWAQILEAIDFDDGDAGNGKPISIEWADPDAPNPNFSLESVPGTNKATLRNLRPFDREKEPEFVLRFELCDNPSSNPQMCAIRPLVVRVGDENDNAPTDGNTFILAYVWPTLGSNVDISTDIMVTEIGEVLVEDPDCCNRSTQFYQMLTTDKDVLKYFSLDNQNIKLAEDTPAGNYVLKVLVTDSLFPNARAISTIYINVEELHQNAMEKAVAVRIKGMTASEFIAIPSAQKGSKSPADKFKDKVAQLLGTQGQNVEIFSISDVPGSDVPVYPQIFDPPAVDVVFAAHGSPYYQSSKIYGYLSENEEEIENSVTDLYFEDVPLNLCPGTCDPTESCSTMLNFQNKPSPILGTYNALVGINVTMEPECGVCESLQTVDLPKTMTQDPHPDPCFDDPCQNNGICSAHVTKVVGNKATYTHKCECSPAYTGPNCELSTLTFKGDGFAWFDSVPQCRETSISLQFSTKEENGLLFYNGPLTLDPDKPDFLALYLFGGALKMVSNFGNGVQTAQLAKDAANPLNDGNWHTVDIWIEEDLIKLQVDLCEDSFINEGASVSSQDYYSCFLVQYLKGRKLDVASPLQVGGVSNTEVLDPNVEKTLFEGCIREFLVNDQILDFNNPARSSNTNDGCAEENDFCFNDDGYPRCGQHGQCIASMYKFLFCDCHPRYQGTTCQHKSPEFTFGPTDSVIRYSVDPNGPVAGALLNERHTEITLSFRSTAKDISEMILLSFHDINDAGFIRIYIARSILSLKHNLGGRGEEILQLREKNVTDGQWHSLRLKRDGKRFKMTLDGGGVPGTIVYSDEGTFRLLQIDPESIMIGGYTSDYSSLDVTSNFQGCISDVRFNRVQLPLGHTSTLNGVSVANRTGITEGCNPDPCATGAVTCPGSFVCTAVFDKAYCACPLGTTLTNIGQCVDILECDIYNPCVHAIDCIELYGSYECICEDDWSGRNCDEAGPAALIATATLSPAAIIIIICSILFLLIILLCCCCYRRSKRPRGLRAADLDFTDHDQKIGTKIVEGGGELDADFVIEHLRKPVNQLPPLTPTSLHASQQILPNGKPPSISHSNQNLPAGGGPRVNPRYIASSPVPSQRAIPPMAPGDDVGRFLRSRVNELDRNAANMGGHDTLMVYHYEGGESEVGTVSDVLSQASEANFDNFSNWGPPFQRLADMFNGPQSSNHNSQRNPPKMSGNNLPPDVV